MRKKIFCLTISLSLLLPAGTVAREKITLAPDNIKEVIASMTLEEKAALIVGTDSKAFDGIGRSNDVVKGAAGTSRAIPRVGVTQMVMADGPAGLRLSSDYVCTRFPIATMLSSGWDTDIVREMGEMLGEEASAYDVDIMLAPALNIHRNPLCGRNFEYFSEDPVLSGLMAASYINGVQSRGVGTSAKHFAANNQEVNRIGNDSRVSERALRELYLRNFEIVVKNSEPWMIMSSYNYLNGLYTAESKDLLTTLLRDEWGYDGMVVSDWGGGYSAPAMIAAGNDMIQPGKDYHYNAIIEAFNNGTLSAADLDRSVERILRTIVKTHRFNGWKPSGDGCLEKHADFSRRTCDEGTVLLKNDERTLPLAKDGEIAVFGVAAYDFVAGGSGSGRVYSPYAVDFIAGLRAGDMRINKNADAFYRAHMDIEKRRVDKINAGKQWFVPKERALEAVPCDLISSVAAEASVAVVCFAKVFGEGRDRDVNNSFRLTREERRLLSVVADAFHSKGKKVVVVLNIGAAMEVEPWQSDADALLVCWQGGEGAGLSLAGILSGKVNPSGRLPMTFPMRYEDDPTVDNFPIVFEDKPINYSRYRIFYNPKPDVVKNIDYTNYEEDIYVGYRYYLTKKVRTAYPFGYGIGYSRFSYGGMSVAPSGDGYKVSLKVTNVSDVAGREVVQIYVQAPGKDKPLRELKGFAKTPLLNPGESCDVEVDVPAYLLPSYDESRHAWVTTGGTYVFCAAQNAEKVVCRAKIRVDEQVKPTNDLFNTDGPLFRK